MRLRTSRFIERGDMVEDVEDLEVGLGWIIGKDIGEG